MSVSSTQILQLTKLISAISNGDTKDVEKECAELSLVVDENNELTELRNEVLKLAQKQLEASEFISNLAKGNLYVEAPKKNRLVDPYKELQANLRHLVWQTQEISRGDYSQHVDFLGDFSNSFNALTEALQEKSRLELALKSSEEKYRDIFENSIEGIFQSTLDGKLLDVNPTYAKLFGYDSPQEMIGKISCAETELYFRAEDRRLIMEKLYNDGFALNVELRFKKRDGSLFWVLSNSRMVRNADGEPMYLEGTMVDITKRKQAEEVVNLSEARLKRAELASLSGNWELHTDTGMIIASDGAKAIYGLDQNQFSLSFVKTLSLPEHRALLDKAMSELLEQNIPYDVEFKIKSQGNGVIKDIRAQAFYDREKKTVFGIIQDITERKRSEEAIKESENQFRTLFCEMSEGFALHEIVYDSNNNAIDYRILNVNSAFEKLIGIKAENAIGKLSTKLYGVEEPPYLDIYLQVAQTGEHQFFQVYFPPLDRYFQISVFSPNPGFFASIFTDITGQKLSGMALEESERRFRDMMEHVNMVSAMLDVNGNITFANDYLLKLTGWKQEEVIGQNWFDVFIPHGVSVRNDLFRELELGKIPVHYENEILTRSGELRLIDWSNSILRNSKGEIEGFAGIGVDITEKKDAEKAIKQSEASLLELNATKDKFFSIIAHDLKSPFNSILGLSNILEERVNEKNYEDIGEFATLIRSSSELAYDLLKNLLEWSRSQTGKMEFSPEYLDMVPLIDDAFQLLENSACQKSIVVTRRLPKNILAFADRAMIGTILRNLISNAVKFTVPGGQIIISAQQTNTEIRVTIADNGIGIRKEDLSKIFRIDENHSTLGTMKEKGTGLGLILCKEFIEKHGGRIWAESEFGKGSQFHFAVPKI